MNWLLIARIIFALLFVIVTYLTLTPNPDDTKSGMAITRWLAVLLLGQEDLGDKVAHFAAYGALGTFAVLSRIRFFGATLFTILALAIYGACLEGLQGLAAVRTPELADAVANALGAIGGWPVGAVFLWLIAKWRAPR